MMIPIKELPLRAVPFVVFLAGCAAFGELFVRMPDTTWAHTIGAWILGAFTVACGVMFFTKLLRDWPRTPGLDLYDISKLT